MPRVNHVLKRLSRQDYFSDLLKCLVQDFCHALEEAGALVRGETQNSMQVRMADCIESGSRVYMLRREVIDEMDDEE